LQATLMLNNNLGLNIFFMRVGWDKKMNFDYIIDTAIDPVRTLKIG